MAEYELPGVALARDLALLHADAMTLDEVAARAARPVAEIVSLLDDPELVALVERESVAGRLSGLTAQAKAAAIRDRALSLLAGRLNEDTSTRALLDVLNVVRPIATREDSQKGQDKFTLVIQMPGAPVTLGGVTSVVDVQVKEVGGGGGMSNFRASLAAKVNAQVEGDPFGARNVVFIPARGDAAMGGGGLAKYASATDAGDMVFPVTVFRGVRGRRMPVLTKGSGTVGAVQLRDIIAPGDSPELVTDGIGGPASEGLPLDRVKKAGVRYVLPFVLPPDTTRGTGTVTSAGWLGLDLDGVEDTGLQRVLVALAGSGLWYLVHPTYSDGLKDGGRRVRVYLLFDQPLSKAQYQQVSGAIAKLLGVTHDPAQAKPEQLAGCWCAPGPEVLAAAGVARRWDHQPKHWGGGKVLDVGKVLADCVGVGPLPAAPATASALPGAGSVSMNGDLFGGLPSQGLASRDRIAEALTWIDPAIPYAQWIRVGQMLKAWGNGADADTALRLWLDWSESAPDERKELNHAGASPADKWGTFAPDAPPDAGAGVVCELAREGATYAVRSARNAATWPDRALSALRYLEKYHRAGCAEFRSADYPPAPAAANEVVGQGDGGGALLSMAQRCGRVVLDQYGNPLLLGALGPAGRLEALPLRDARVFDALLLGAVESGAKRLPGKDAIAGALSVLGARARKAGTVIPVYRRIARTTRGVVIDLGDDQGRAVVVDASGVRIQTQAEHGVHFRRPDGYCPLPAPTETHSTPEGVRASWDVLTDWLHGLGIPVREVPLVAVALVRWVLPGGTFPILEIVGPAGQGKSTKTDLLASLIDPQPGGRAISPIDLDVRTVAAACTAACVVTFDNLSRMDVDESDMLCKLTTGYRLSTRELHTTADARHLDAHVRVIINGIAPVLTRGDALDRAVRVAIGLGRGGLKPVEQVHAEFNARHADLLGAMGNLLAAALRHWDDAGPADHRLVEFATTGRALYVALGKAPSEFSAAFHEHRRDTAVYMSEGDPVLRALQKAVEHMMSAASDAVEFPAWGGWHPKPGWVAIKHPRRGVMIMATPAALLDLMKAHAPTDVMQDWRDRAALPRHPRALAGAMARVTPTLKAMGWDVRQCEISAKRAAWLFTQVEVPE